jgi:hypothetical protein
MGFQTIEYAVQGWHGITRASFCPWKSKFGGMEVSAVKRLTELAEKNRQLKHSGSGRRELRRCSNEKVVMMCPRLLYQTQCESSVDCGFQRG